MREIKFKVWDGVNMIYPDWLATHESGKYWQVKPNDNYDAEEYPLMQFTGLRDKNGKEIYEGDIVIWKQALGGILQADSDPKTCVIEWDEFFSSWKCRDINKEDHFRGYTFHECHMESVIGNIYSNPELLNEK